jgi:hypothetical protein
VHCSVTTSRILSIEQRQPQQGLVTRSRTLKHDDQAKSPRLAGSLQIKPLPNQKLRDGERALKALLHETTVTR